MVSGRVLFPLFACMAATPAFADEQASPPREYLDAYPLPPERWEVGLYGGLLMISPAHDLRERVGLGAPHYPFERPSVEFGWRLGYHPLAFLGIEAEGTHGEAKLDAASLDDRVGVMLASYDAQLVLSWPAWSIAPFVALGGGVMGAASRPLGREYDPFGHAGVGGRFALESWIAVRVDARGRFHERDTREGGSVAVSPEVTLGVAFTLGGDGGRVTSSNAPPSALPPDADRDHVPDAADACPELGYLDTQDGCPPDSDGDGVRDPNDYCPREAGIEVLDGCPDPDSDKDGVRGVFDRCPDEAGVPPEGCPVRDQDGDGILDGLDACVDRAENKNGFEDEDGCPDMPTGVLDFSKVEGVVQGIAFDADGSELIVDDPAFLRGIAEFLEQYPDLTIEISGHTDNQGGAVRSQALSQNRAESVKLWLVDHGVAAGRIRAVGRGSSEPRASNRTADGRAANRRIEVRVIAEESVGRE